MSCTQLRFFFEFLQHNNTFLQLCQNLLFDVQVKFHAAIPLGSQIEVIKQFE